MSAEGHLARMWKWITRRPRRASVILGAVGFIYGLPGMIDDGKVWIDWLQLDQWWSGFVSGIGAALVASWLVHACAPIAQNATKAFLELCKDPGRTLTIKRAYRAPNNGIHMAKLIRKARSADEAQELFDLFRGSASREKEAAPYAAFAHMLARFDHLGEAAAILLDMNDLDVPELEKLEARDEFYDSFPEDEECGDWR